MRRPTTTEPLTDRERAVLELIAAGRTNPEIAHELSITYYTARNHVSNVLAKLGVETRDEAAAWWRDHRHDRAVRRSRLSWARALFALGPAKAVAGVVGIAGVAALAVALVALAVMARPGEDEPVEPAGGAGDETATPGAPPPATATAEVSAIAPPQRTLSAEPTVVDCVYEFRLYGEGWEPGARVDVYLWLDLNEARWVFGPSVDENGVLDVTVIPPPEDPAPPCAPGMDMVWEVRVPDEEPPPGEPWPRTVVTVEPLGPLVTEPASGVCGPADVTVRGSGFPADATVLLYWGDDEPFAHNFAELTRVRSDEAGRIDAPVTLPGPGPDCTPGDSIAVRARVDGVEATWKTIYTYTGEDEATHLTVRSAFERRLAALAGVRGKLA